ncbi:hypothetical protein ACFRIB_48500 [Streptomyces mirabilis]|uniref:hypothetical protein n=1 Tax=Streptomyces mirabilis TaxID=68239 RepID=UPI0036B50F07
MHSAPGTDPVDPASRPATSAPIVRGSVAAREAMVARLEETGTLRSGLVRDALLAVRREVLIPQAYVRRSPAGEVPPRWDLLDWAEPADREELLALLYGGESVLIQHAGERVLGRVPGPRSGGAITSMSSVVGLTAGLLQDLDLQRGQRARPCASSATNSRSSSGGARTSE